jgi:hypothetical protein
MWVQVPPSVLFTSQGLRVATLSPFFVGLRSLVFESVAARWFCVGFASLQVAHCATQTQHSLYV